MFWMLTIMTLILITCLSAKGNTNSTILKLNEWQKQTEKQRNKELMKWNNRVD